VRLQRRSRKKTPLAFAATAAKATNPQECMAATAAMHSKKILGMQFGILTTTNYLCTRYQK
jgi:hypothetical protein